MDIKQLRDKLSAYGQEHLIAFWDELPEAEKTELYNELDALDVKEVTEYFQRTVESMNDAGQKVDDRMQPLAHDQCGSILEVSDEEKDQFERISYAKIAEGKMGILLLAGGQGTRLGVAYPKGMYDVGLPSGKTLFQLQAERILKLQRLAEEETGKVGYISWYIMTSASTVDATTNFFKTNNYFGLRPQDVIVFQQGTLPCFSFDGKIILNSKSALARAPDGNGGLYRALRTAGILEDMKKRDVQYIQLYCVDNILVRVGDPVFTGYCISKGAECANKVVPKGHPHESVGITCKVDGQYQVVEYSEITNASAERRNDDGSLTYSAANICIHFFTRAFLERIVLEHEQQLIHHVAKKKIPYVNENGERITPTKPNGIKMEKFVFDVFRFANNFVVWECVREDEFAPLKNADGASDFTPTHCRNALYALHQKYVIEAGGKLVEKDGSPAPVMVSPAAPKEKNNNNNNEIEGKSPVVVCEVSPLVTYAGEGLEKLVKGKTIQVPTSQIGLRI